MGYGTRKQLDCPLCVAQLNELDGANGSGSMLGVSALTPLHHLLNYLGLFVLSTTVLDIPADHQTKKQRDGRGE